MLSNLKISGKNDLVIKADTLKKFRTLQKHNVVINGNLCFNKKTEIYNLLSMDMDLEIDCEAEYFTAEVYKHHPPFPADLVALLKSSIENGVQFQLYFSDQHLYIVSPTEPLLYSYMLMTKIEKEAFYVYIDEILTHSYCISQTEWLSLVNKLGWSVEVQSYANDVKIRMYSTTH